MEDLFDFYNPLNNNNLTVYIIVGLLVFLLLFLPEKLPIFSTKGIAILSIFLTVLVVAHQTPFIKELIPYF